MEAFEPLAQRVKVLIIGATPASPTLLEHQSPLLSEYGNPVGQELLGQTGILLVALNTEKVARLAIT